MAYEWLNDNSVRFLLNGYIKGKYKQDIHIRIIEILDNAEKILGRKLDMLRKGLERGWVSFSSPIWANFGKENGLPISCNGSYVEDSITSILDTVAEIGVMTKYGAGTSCYMGKIRPSGSIIADGGHALGPTHFASLYQEVISVITQSNIRRGNCAVWLDIEHPDIEEWLSMRSHTEGVFHKIQHLSFGVCIGRQWFNDMLNEPKGGKKRLIMAALINKRRSTGYPYIFFRDHVNNNAPDVLKDNDIKIHASNLCAEIMLPSNEEESFVCNLSSLNLLYYDDWCNTNIVKDLVYFLDAVLTEYIKKIKNIKHLERAYKFANKWRAMGIGVLGYHSYLQSHMIPFESETAREFNKKAHKWISEQCKKASKKMAEEYGEPSGLKCYGRRHLCLNAIAPTTSSSLILGQVSPSIEPWESNYFENDSAKGVFTYRNPHLIELLERKGINIERVWTDILEHDGSIQHMECFSDLEKAVFKTAIEIDQFEIIQQAADRQPYIDQGQSLNLFVHPDKSMSYNFQLIKAAYDSGLKSLYYHKSRAVSQELIRKNKCKACEG